MGLRSMRDNIPAAFLGSLEMSLPFLTGQGGQCKLLESVIGDFRQIEKKARWRLLVESGCRTGLELERCWAGLQKEAYMGERVEQHLAILLEGIGEGRVDGKISPVSHQADEETAGKSAGNRGE